MATGLASWSSTAAANATADATVNWAEGQAPSSVNDSARAMMASLRKWLNDICAATSTGGTSTAYTVTTQQGFASLSALAGQIIGFTPHTNCGATVTLAVDGLAARPLRSGSNTELTASQIKGGAPILATFNGTDSVYYIYNMTSGLLALSGLSPIASVSVLGNSSNVASTVTTLNLETPISFTNATSIGITTAGIAYSKIQNVASVSLLGCGSTTSTAVTEIKLGSTLKFTNASTLDVNTVSAATIASGQIALARGGTNADLSATGGANQVLMQSASGGNITVAQLSLSNLSNSTTGTGSVVLANTPTLVTPVIGAATGTSLSVSGAITGGAITCTSVAASGSILTTSLSGLGYATGAGGSVTQATDKTTSVTLHAPTGIVNMNAANLNTGVTVSFTVVNSTVAATDHVALNHAQYGSVGSYLLYSKPASGSFIIFCRNVSGANLAESLGVQYTVIKAVQA